MAKYYRFATPDEVEEFLADPHDDRFAYVWDGIENADILIEWDSYSL